ncbi:MAG: hypothetical protein NT023_05875 [Armatimonadetes bacterium]|nr:hypothetical protein [Armatimonadota bacterium]
MKIDFIQEPELEFGAAKHIDIRFGLMNYGPFDFANRLAPKDIRLGFIGTPQTIQGIEAWLDKCKGGIEAKKSNQPQLFPRFPGFGPDVSYRASFVTSPQLHRAIPQREFERLGRWNHPDRLIVEAVDLFLSEIEHIAENHPAVDVIICAIPLELLELMRSEDTDSYAQNEEVGEDGIIRLNFRDMLKAQAMKYKKPIQLVLPMTYDPTKKLKPRLSAKTKEDIRCLQDEATRAWNIHTALYYKANGTPWRLVRDSSQPTTCYVGISFYISLDGARLQTSMAQVFNERGDGIIVRGGAAKQSKDDRKPYLEEEDAFKLLTGALQRYRKEHYNMPARVVVHKSSPFKLEEKEGFRQAAEDSNIGFIDFISLSRTYTRLMRIGNYPPLRGTLLTLDERNHVLYTRGSVDFFSTYPGMYVPTPLKFRCEETDQEPHFLAQEILGLTKMNWNDTQFDGGSPITIGGARYVGSVLKYLGEEDTPEARYSYYM